MWPPQAGLNLFATASGVVVDDFENNGLFDVVTSSYDACARCTISTTMATARFPTSTPGRAERISWAA